MSRQRAGDHRLGSNVVELILPHRRPMLLVDQIGAYSESPEPRLVAYKVVSANEVFFDGHFPGLHLWPGVLTIEGLGQTCALLIAIRTMRAEFASVGRDPDDLIEALRNLDRGYRMDPGFRPDDADAFVQLVGRHRQSIAVGAAVNVKLHRPVFAGQCLEYRATATRDLEQVLRCEVEAVVDGAVVASGTMTGARMTRFVMPRAP